MPFIEKVFNNTLSVFELNDALQFSRLDTLFQLNNNKNTLNKEPFDIEDNKSLPLFEYLYEERENHINLVLYILYNIGKAIEKYDIVGQYFEKNKNKIEWIKYFLIELRNDQKMRNNFLKNNNFIIAQHPDLMHVIQENIVRRFGFDSS